MVEWTGKEKDNAGFGGVLDLYKAGRICSRCVTVKELCNGHLSAATAVARSISSRSRNVHLPAIQIEPTTESCCNYTRCFLSASPPTRIRKGGADSTNLISIRPFAPSIACCLIFPTREWRVVSSRTDPIQTQSLRGLLQWEPSRTSRHRCRSRRTRRSRRSPAKTAG